MRAASTYEERAAHLSAQGLGEGMRATWCSSDYRIRCTVEKVTPKAMVRIRIEKPTHVIPATKLVEATLLTAGWPEMEVRWDANDHAAR